MICVGKRWRLDGLEAVVCAGGAYAAREKSCTRRDSCDNAVNSSTLTSHRVLLYSCSIAYPTERRYSHVSTTASRCL